MFSKFHAKTVLLLPPLPLAEVKLKWGTLSPAPGATLCEPQLQFRAGA
jgi:hypothetical protein